MYRTIRGEIPTGRTLSSVIDASRLNHKTDPFLFKLKLSAIDLKAKRGRCHCRMMDLVRRPSCRLSKTSDHQKQCQCRGRGATETCREDIPAYRQLVMAFDRRHDVLIIAGRFTHQYGDSLLWPGNVIAVFACFRFTT